MVVGRQPAIESAMDIWTHNSNEVAVFVVERLNPCGCPPLDSEREVPELGESSHFRSGESAQLVEEEAVDGDGGKQEGDEGRVDDCGGE